MSWRQGAEEERAMSRCAGGSVAYETPTPVPPPQFVCFFRPPSPWTPRARVGGGGGRQKRPTQHENQENRQKGRGVSVAGGGGGFTPKKFRPTHCRTILKFLLIPIFRSATLSLIHTHRARRPTPFTPQCPQLTYIAQSIHTCQSRNSAYMLSTRHTTTATTSNIV